MYHFLDEYNIELDFFQICPGIAESGKHLSVNSYSYFLFLSAYSKIRSRFISVVEEFAKSIQANNTNDKGFFTLQ